MGNRNKIFVCCWMMQWRKEGCGHRRGKLLLSGPWVGERREPCAHTQGWAIHTVMCSSCIATRGTAVNRDPLQVRG